MAEPKKKTAQLPDGITMAQLKENWDTASREYRKAMRRMQLLDAAGLFRLIGNETVCSVLKGLLEMTAGSSMLSACNISLQMKTVLTAVLVSFGGLSVIGQSVSMAEGSGIGMKDILQRKATHGLLAGILAVFLAGIMV